MSFAILGGSHREHPRASVFVGRSSPDETLQISCVLRRREGVSAHPETSLSHADFSHLHGADPADVEALEHFAAEHHFTVVSVNSASRTVTIEGKLSALAAIFGADIELRQVGSKIMRTRSGSQHVPLELANKIVAVFGFDQRPVAISHHRVLTRAGQTSYTPPQVAQAYNFPKNKGANQTIALIELGGGYNDSDLKTYWKQLGLPNVSTVAVGVDGAVNAPTGDPTNADGEVALDIEIAGAIAPSARIAVYFAPNSDQGFFDAINAAIHDQVRRPSVISISWGGPEDRWTPQALNAFNAAFHDAALLGISVCAASGDNGSSDGEQDGLEHVDFPASSPWVLACGGTRLQANAGQIVSETVWNGGSDGGATGGGVSGHFSNPAYQHTAHVPKPTLGNNPTGRGVPDVAGNADPATGYLIVVDGQSGVIGGTSAVAPLWAGLIALLNEELGKNVGWLHRYLYGALTRDKALHDIVSGNNGDFHAQRGWDACTGLGSPDGQAILDILKQVF